MEIVSEWIDAMKGVRIVLPRLREGKLDKETMSAVDRALNARTRMRAFKESQEVHTLYSLFSDTK